uniref:Uncharacterized protein n=1 Tax=Myotis myotis TaxID=51298 RepID=A0A7J7WWD3_MYOMY|nr:hypothetical protein mMyoMyo1_011952 [Myotis myotis]
MPRQTNMSQMKEMEESKLPDIEFKTPVIRLLKNLLETSTKMEKDHSEIKHILTEIKNNIQVFNSRVEDSENQINDLEYEEAKTTQPEEQKEKRIQKYKDSVRNLLDNFKRTNIHIMGVPEEREQDIENLFEEIMTENFPYLVKG